MEKPNNLFLVHTRKIGAYSDMNPEQRESVLGWRFIASLVLGITAAFEIELVGRLSVQELLLAIFASVFLFLRSGQLRRIHRQILAAIACWLVIQMATDVIRDIPIADMSRGAARIIFFGLSFVFIVLWVRDSVARVAGFLLGLGVSLVVTYFTNPTIASLADPWKWHFAVASTHLGFGLILFSPLRGNKWVWILFSLAIAIISIFGNFRSHAGIMMLFASRLALGEVWLRIPVFGRLFTLCGLGLCFLLGYIALAQANFMGDSGRQKLEAQFNVDQGVISIITGGRRESRPAAQAIIDSPFLGYGSWAQHPEYVALLWDGLEGVNPAQFATNVELGIIPTHSFFSGAWVDGGPFPAMFWLVIWFCALNCLLKIRFNASGLEYIGAYSAIWFMWNIAFSPFGAGMRVSAAFFLVVLLAGARSWMRPLSFRKLFTS